ncbi:MAG: 5-methylcytosine-specific restriction endonuclease system specificity protein McrC [bacterium]|nr:5-methylcytosine-specific restriction endonuclease system specificity protein McrC [bacterium]MDE0643427.1 5-methylcytosine-specific restriction endonuclease system specificity protein McrC [bacterium]
MTPPPGMIGKIPIRNIWLLMLYASRLYRELPSRRTRGIEESPDRLPDLVAEILTRAAQRRIRRNLTLEFRRSQADLTRVRGRIDILRTERYGLLRKGKIACSFEELTTDTPRNRLVKAALTKLCSSVREEDLARRCRSLAAALGRAGVSDETSTGIRSRSLRATGRVNAEDRQMLAAAELALRLSLPTEDLGRANLPAPGRDEAWARQLFEKAVGGFYDTVLGPRGWSVKRGKRIHWQIKEQTKTSRIDDILPQMQTDITLEGPPADAHDHRHRIVIDTKFTGILKPGQYKTHLESGYIYQIYAYLRSQERDSDPGSLDSSGLLLHPSVGEDVHESAVIQGHRIHFATVDLAAESTAIRARLIAIADEVAA